MEAGAPYGIAPYGTEALGVMRVGKATSPEMKSTGAPPPMISPLAH